MKSIVSLLVILAAFAFSAAAAGTQVYSIPACPHGLTLKIYTFNPSIKKISKPLPTAKGYQDVQDATQYLLSHGIHFPKNGFALYFKNNNFLIAATDRGNQDLLTIFLD